MTPIKSPLISIITPSFNQGEFLEETILSVLNQAYEDIEYIVIDGGSTDNSVSIIEKYKDRLAYWVSEPDNGQAEAIQKGMEKASGKYVAWLNSDDVYRINAVSNAISTLEVNPALGLVYGDLDSINLRSEIINTISYRNYSLVDLLSFNIIGQPTVFMRKNIYDQVGGISSDYHFLLDHHLWIRMSQISKFQYVPKVWAAARMHPHAKNISQAEKFGQEANAIYLWALNQPPLSKIISKNKKQVLAGLHRFDARYLLDAQLNAKSLKAYWKSFLNQPLHALKHWHRILFAMLSLIGLGGLRKFVYRKYR
jgi:glycosyltransferase involved in cell wall biosynthesis